MEYKKIIKLLDNAPNQRAKFKTKNWMTLVERRTLIVKLSLKLQC